ncbi:glycine/betaine ABC transporter permease [Desulfovibrio fairfieldensis]|uniref:Glycine/betaine ABC transporter permease n=1 Tax=Desulfovibrio fairfieldensis TaxID=44742 RepID=A0A0X8JM10_9BACT|nr:glycine/betaine ABC transporter permease [Desulfovibrio fairfieldensis]
MEARMRQAIIAYFMANSAAFWAAVREHVLISAASLAVALLIAVPGGYLCVRYGGLKKALLAVFQTLRIVPSLAVLFLLIPVMGTGFMPATAALVLLAVPPILLNTVAGLDGVPQDMLETAAGLGMTRRQVWRKVRFPLAMPMILTGVKIAVIEIIASATLAAKIGAGGLGEIIFTGLGLNRIDLLLIGGFSVALLSLAGGLTFAVLGKALFRYREA